MSARRLIAGLLGAAALTLTWATAADAAVFCVQDPTCVSGGGTSQPTVQDALDAADANGPGADTVRIGPTPTPIPGGFAGTSSVDVIGAGPNQTQLTASSGKVLNLDGIDSDVTDLGIVMSGNAGYGVETTGSATRVSVSGDSSFLAGYAISVGAGTSSELFVDVRSTFMGLTFGVGVFPVNLADTSPITIEDSRITAGGPAVATTGSGSAVFRRVAMRGTMVGFQSSNSNAIRFENTSLQVDVRALEAAIVAQFGVRSIVADHLTLVGSGTYTGIRAISSCAPSGGVPIDVDITDSIIRGFETDIWMSGPSGPCMVSPTDPPAVADVSYSIYDPAKVLASGPGAVNVGPGVLNADPLLTGKTGGDVALAVGSPAIDSGDPAGLGPGDSVIDRNGNPRVVDGNGDDIARTDMGALEAPAIADIARELSLKYSKKRRTFKGVLSSTDPSCTDATVEVRKKGKKGKSKRVGSAGTNADGEFSLKKKGKKGKRYFAVVAESPTAAGNCLEAKSKTLKVKKPKKRK